MDTGLRSANYRVPQFASFNSIWTREGVIAIEHADGEIEVESALAQAPITLLRIPREYELEVRNHLYS